jgi:hypothetical protein
MAGNPRSQYRDEVSAFHDLSLGLVDLVESAACNATSGASSRAMSVRDVMGRFTLVVSSPVFKMLG